jgi:hypothetical protein
MNIDQPTHQSNVEHQRAAPYKPVLPSGVQCQYPDMPCDCDPGSCWAAVLISDNNDHDYPVNAQRS